MEFTGKLAGITKDWQSGQFQITFTVNEPSAMNTVNDIKDCDKLSIRAVKFRAKRSLNANALLWLCLGRLADALRMDKWDLYKQMLKRHGKYTYICVKPNVVDAVKAQWRECEVIGEVDINGQKAVQMLCYFGSSTFNTKEFSVFLDDVISEMRDQNLDTPTSSDMKRALEQWEKMHEKVT
jgi:hypothetical protein